MSALISKSNLCDSRCRYCLLTGAGLEFSVVKDWRLEQLSTFLEARASLRGIQLGVGRPHNHAEALESLKVLVCYVLRAEGGTRACELHKRLFELAKPSAVISFNYDLIADQSMLKAGLLDWRATEYRGASRAAVPTSRGTAYKLFQGGRDSHAIALLKLHGSIHFEKVKRGDSFRLSGCSLPTNHHPTFDNEGPNARLELS